jgi:hypothetical protein
VQDRRAPLEVFVGRAAELARMAEVLTRDLELARTRQQVT